MDCPSCHTANDANAETCFRCGKNLFAVTQGTVLAGRYEIRRLLGRGGMGMVYLAHDGELDEDVAVKTLRSDVAQDADSTQRFRSEIKLARRVTHPNVCRIHEYGREGHLHYIVMEYVEGVDLRRVIKEGGRLPPHEAYDTAIQVARALEAIHAVGIVHRDLKTPNIMRDRLGRVQVMDFGVAKSADPGAPPATATGHVVGTPEYMSPEQAQSHPIDSRSDIYALGIVIFELFTGDLPFRGETPVATLMKQIQEPPPLSGGKAAHLPPAVVPILARALAKSPGQRFATAAEMAQALERARAEPSPETEALPTQSATAAATAVETAGPRVVARRRALLAAAAAAAALVSVAARLWLRDAAAPLPSPPHREPAGTPVAQTATPTRGVMLAAAPTRATARAASPGAAPTPVPPTDVSSEPAALVVSSALGRDRVGRRGQGPNTGDPVAGCARPSRPHPHDGRRPRLP